MSTIINQHILDELTAQAKVSPRLRMNLDLRNSPTDKSQRMLKAIEPGTLKLVGQWHSLSTLENGMVLSKGKDGKWERMGEKIIC